MNRIKKWFEQTPAKRISNAYWLGSFQMLIFMGFLQDFKGKEGYIELIQNHWTEMHWGWWVAAWFLVVFLFLKNNLAFRRETLWMTIKNPAKVTREDGDPVNPVNIRPKSAPPPPAPPQKRTYNPGPAWPPKKK